MNRPGDGDENGATSFEDRILELVLAALAGKNVEEETRLAERSIEEAKAELEREEASINAMLGSMDGAEYVGPRTPSLPGVVHSMEPRDFTLAALRTLGTRLTPKPPDLYLAEEKGGREYIRFEQHAARDTKSTLYAPGSAAFQRLVDRVIATGIHEVVDLDRNPTRESEDIARKWIEGFGAKPKAVELDGVRRSFGGTALLRVRTTVAHDSYERLIEVPCSHEDHRGKTNRSASAPLGKTIDDPVSLGIDIAKITDAASMDEGISEFSRFYLERREQEMKGAEGDERKRKKLQDEFTPRLEITLVGLEGTLHREIKLRTRFAFGSEAAYESALTVTPHDGKVVDAPEQDLCSESGRKVPSSCLAKCEVTGSSVLRHLLASSEISGRLALPEFSARCSLSNKRVLTDELEASSVTAMPVASSLLKTSAVSGKRAEPEHFGRCTFTDAEVLNGELALSEISGKRYRIDEQMRSAASGKTGHKQEFIVCHETRQPIAHTEAEQCEVTGKQVRLGVLKNCDVTGRQVLPSELETCSATGKTVLKRLLVTSSVSQAPRSQRGGVSSIGRDVLRPSRSTGLLLSGRIGHPDDLRICTLTGLPIHFEFATPEGAPRLKPLVEMLDGIRRNTDETGLWNTAAARIEAAAKSGKCRVEAAMISPAKQYLATCSEAKAFLGLRVYQVGAVYDLTNGTIFGRIAVGKRSANGWVDRKH
jgi:hypothetical protein